MADQNKVRLAQWLSKYGLSNFTDDLFAQGGDLETLVSLNPKEIDTVTQNVFGVMHQPKFKDAVNQLIASRNGGSGGNGGSADPQSIDLNKPQNTQMPQATSQWVGNNQNGQQMNHNQMKQQMQQQFNYGGHPTHPHMPPNNMPPNMVPNMVGNMNPNMVHQQHQHHYQQQHQMVGGPMGGGMTGYPMNTPIVRQQMPNVVINNQNQGSSVDLGLQAFGKSNDLSKLLKKPKLMSILIDLLDSHNPDYYQGNQKYLRSDLLFLSKKQKSDINKFAENLPVWQLWTLIGNDNHLQTIESVGDLVKGPSNVSIDIATKIKIQRILEYFHSRKEWIENELKNQATNRANNMNQLNSKDIILLLLHTMLGFYKSKRAMSDEKVRKEIILNCYVLVTFVTFLKYSAKDTSIVIYLQNTLKTALNDQYSRWVKTNMKDSKCDKASFYSKFHQIIDAWHKKTMQMITQLNKGSIINNVNNNNINNINNIDIVTSKPNDINMVDNNQYNHRPNQQKTVSNNQQTQPQPTQTHDNNQQFQHSTHPQHQQHQQQQHQQQQQRAFFQPNQPNPQGFPPQQFHNPQSGGYVNQLGNRNMHGMNQQMRQMVPNNMGGGMSPPHGQQFVNPMQNMQGMGGYPPHQVHQTGSGHQGGHQGGFQSQGQQGGQMGVGQGQGYHHAQMNTNTNAMQQRNMNHQINPMHQMPPNMQQFNNMQQNTNPQGGDGK